MTSAEEFRNAWKNGQVNGMGGEPSGNSQKSQMIEEHPQLRIANALHATLPTANIVVNGISTTKDGATSYNFTVNKTAVSFVAQDDGTYAIYSNDKDFVKSTFGSHKITDEKLNELSSRALDQNARASTSQVPPALYAQAKNIAPEGFSVS